MTFEVKDSGERMEFASGMVRDTDDSKTNYALVMDGPLLKRWAVHLTKGAKKYAPRNWMLARGDAEYNRFRESAVRHFIQWYNGDTDEDHAAAVVFNINGAEYVKGLPDYDKKWYYQKVKGVWIADRDPGDENDEWPCRCPSLHYTDGPCCKSELEGHECCCEQNK